MPDQLTREERAMRTLQALRPTPAPDPARAARDLAAILDEPLRPPATGRRRRWTVGAGFGAAVVVLGGAAYGGGLVPDVVSDRLGEGDQREPIHRIGEVREVFDLTAADGTRVQFFVAPNDAGGECWTVTHDLDSDTEPGDLSYTCVSGPIDGFPPPSDDGVGVVPTDSDHEGPPILFGFAGGDFDLPDGTAAVGVAGPGVDETILVTEPEGWAVELPAPAATERYVVRFLDADGRTLHQVTERVDP